MKDFYDAYWSQEHPPPTRDPLTPRRLEILWSFLGEPGRPLRLLDVGCGEGVVTAAAAGRGIEALGMDISEQCLERARSAYPACRFVRHSVDERPWPVEPASLDVVVSFEVIEHLLRPRELLAGAFESLRPGGQLALTTPYHGRLKNVTVALAAFDRHFDADGSHIRFFSDGALKRLLQDAGFEVQRVVHYGRCWGLWAGAFVWAGKS